MASSAVKKNLISVITVITIMVYLNFDSLAVLEATVISKKSVGVGGTLNGTAHFRCSGTTLDCTDWIPNAFDGVLNAHASITSKTENSTELKICELKGDHFDHDDDGRMVSAGLGLATGAILLKCNGALLEFGKGSVTCGHPRPSNESGFPVHDFDVVLANELPFPGIWQHTIDGGLDFSGVVWNFLQSELSNLHVLTGEGLKDFFTQIVGVAERVHIASATGSVFWFRRLYLGGVPTDISPQMYLPTEIKSAMQRIEYKGGGNAMLPCSVYSMDDFHDWRVNISQPQSQESQLQASTNGTLLYLQRVRKRILLFKECERAVDNSTCSCRTVPEAEFIERLDALSRRHGLEMQVFRQSSLKKDAETFAQARVIIGPHGGAFVNMIFLNPDLDPIIIEAHAHQSVFDCCNEQFSVGPIRHFFTHLAASLGHKHKVYHPNIISMGGYRPKARLTLEIKDYLEFIEKTMLGIDTGKTEMLAPFHPCVPWMQ